MKSQNKKKTAESKIKRSTKNTTIKKVAFDDYLKNLDAPILITNSNLSTIIANKQLAKLFGVSQSKISYEFLQTLIFKDFGNHTVPYSNLPFNIAAAKRKNITDVEVKFTSKDNVEKWLRINSFITERTKNSVSVASVFVENTKEADLESIFRETLSNINTVLFSTSVDGTEFNFISEAVRTIFGYSPEEVYSRKFKLIRSIKKEYFNAFKLFVDELKSGKESFVEYLMLDRFGKEHWVRHSGIPLFNKDKVVRIVGMISDITDEKFTQLKLERSEERFRVLIDTADDLIFTLNGFGYFSMVNKNGANALGYSPEEMIGRHFLEFIDKEDEGNVAEAFSKILNSSGITIFEAIFLDRFDKGVLFEVHSKPITAGNEISGMLSIGRNITRRKSDEQKINELNFKLIEANRIISIERERARHKITVLEELNKLKSEFISNVSHELRTPLASIVGFAETIFSDPELPKDTLKEFSGIILSEGNRLAKLINDLLDFAKLESGEEELNKEEINLNEVVDFVINNYSRAIEEKKLTLTKQYPEKDQTLKADKERITKVISNIISNAIKFTDSEGRISVIVQDFGKEVEVAISDTGIGIPEVQLQSLFQKFGKLNRPGAQLTGAGFGLVSSKQIIDLHKGFIKARSEENKGTTFIIRLPK